MSKAFTSEETIDAPVVTADRAPLPAGVTNYVTSAGLMRLKAELAQLRAGRADPRRITELEVRISCASLVDPAAQPRDEVRFGATVVVRGDSGQERRYQIVGVDEANLRDGKVAFVAPVARALLGKRVGETATVRAPHGEDELEVVSICYD